MAISHLFFLPHFSKVLRDEFRVNPKGSNVAQGDTVVLECESPRGSPEPVISWKKNGQTLDTNSSKR
jgi:roundabout, axon guidance receptor 2